jgi:uncharacterized protein (DUF58 family)
MQPEVINRLRQSKLQLSLRRKPSNIFPGQWESVYVGEGIEFAAIKAFEPGDDLRELDLHTLAQSGEEDLIQRIDERQTAVYVWVDTSGSMQHFEAMLFAQKRTIRAIATGLLLFSASNAYSPVGLCAFADKVTEFFPARSGESYAEEIWRWTLEHQHESPAPAADFDAALAYLIHRVPSQSLVFLVSDYQDPIFEGDFSALLRPVATRFDLVPVIIRDPLECEATLRGPVRIAVRDSEGDGSGEIYMTPERLVEIQAISAGHLGHLARSFRRVGIEPVVLDSSSLEACHEAFAAFFQARLRTRA